MDGMLVGQLACLGRRINQIESLNHANKSDRSKVELNNNNKTNPKKVKCDTSNTHTLYRKVVWIIFEGATKTTREQANSLAD